MGEVIDFNSYRLNRLEASIAKHPAKGKPKPERMEDSDENVSGSE